MTELPTENVIYICNKSIDILRTDICIEDKFTELVIMLEKEAGIVIAFCEIIIPRWKFIAGSKDFTTPLYKYSNEVSRYGIMVQDWGLLENESTRLIDVLFENINSK